MTKWQRRARLVIAIGAVVFAVVVVFALKRRAPQPAAGPALRTDPEAVVEVTGGRVERFSFSRQDVRVAYERQLTYADGSTRLMDVTIAADQRAGRSFTVAGREAAVGQNESLLQLTGDVQLTASDGMAVRAENASYSAADGFVRASGPVKFSRGRMTGSGLGMTYDTEREVLVILASAVVDVAPDRQGNGGIEIASGTAAFVRPEQNVRFERDVTLQRSGQTIEAGTAVAYLTPDGGQVARMELREGSRIGMDAPAAGGLQELSGRDIDLRYGDGGEALEHALLTGEANIVVAGGAGTAGRRIQAGKVDVALAPDGATPVALTAREAVVLTLPAEGLAPGRTIAANAMDAKGQPDRGLTEAQFRGEVDFRERSAGTDRQARAAVLDVGLAPGMAGIDEARFSRGVRFVDGPMTSSAAAARYDLGRGILELTGSEPGALRPRVVNDRLAVDATRIDVTLAGPHLKATGAVKSVVQAGKGTPSPGAGRGAVPASGLRLPAMFKQDAPTNVTADALVYDGTAHEATYSGNAQLWQEATSLKGGTIVLDDERGDLTATGGVTSVTVRDVVSATNKTERVRTIATAAEFRYEEASRRTTYVGKAHMNGPDGDLTAARIEVYLGLSGAEIERLEAYDEVTLRDQNRTTTGTRLTYTAAEQRYVVTGVPVKVVDACGRESIGRTLTYVKSSETVTLDGNQQVRTRTTGGAQCP